MIDLLGVVGITISIVAYIPQVVHLAREHCSAGVSPKAWTLWLISALLVSIVAFERRDVVFIMLQLSTLTSATVILILAHRYQGMACESHRPVGPRGSERDGSAQALAG